MMTQKGLINLTFGLLMGVPLFGSFHLLNELPHDLNQNTLDTLVEKLFFPCEFEEIPLDLNQQAIDFECRGNPFLTEDLVGESIGKGSWGRFGRKHDSPSNYIQVAYAQNPKTSPINHSSTVLSITEQPHVESWAGFFFDLNSKIDFPKDMNAISLDVFSKKPGQKVLLKLEDSTNGGLFSESQVFTTETNSWEKLIHDFPPSDTHRFDRMTLILDLGNVNETQTTYYIDNIAFSTPNQVSDLPKIQPPTPQNPTANVFSVFSDPYPSIPKVNLYPQWGQQTEHSIVRDSLANSLLKYFKLDYQGIEFAPINQGLDVSQMTHLHIDYYVVSAVNLRLSLISTQPTTEVSYPLPTHQKKRWISMDIPLDRFSDTSNGVDLTKVFQFKIEELGDPHSGSIIYLDNLYFYRANQLELVWSDEFEDDEINLNDWTFELGNGCPHLCGWGNQELQHYTEENHRLQDGFLIIEAKKSDQNAYTSTRIKTEGKREFTYGRIEARIKLPRGEGLWPAFWLLGANIKEVGWPACGEIDIMEYVGKQPGMIHNAIHTTSSYFTTQNKQSTMIPNVEEGFHVYAINWTSDAIEFYFDDQMTYRYAPEVKNEKNYPFDNPQFLLLNLAIGGNFGGPVGDLTQFPQQYMIDYVRVYSPNKTF
ncbi:MAG: glycoside hydrolase family 16 protein [Flavobacteriaceae bacterium]|nr:glycoside hydrolase family 16 protein [Flavobacteriaceae bacterium]